MLPVKQMLALEEWVEKVKQQGYIWPMSIKDVKEKLNLDVVEKQLDSSLEARLIPPTSDSSNGVIEVNTQYSTKDQFGYAHEVVHYLKDVGVGNKVTHPYSRLSSPSDIDQHEREIDYCTAAYTIPKDSLADEIKRYRKNWYAIDEVKFFNDLMSKYSCKRECLILRIKEIQKMGLLSK